MKRSSSAGYVPISLILNIVLTVVVLAVSGFAIWAYMGYQDNKNNVDSKVNAAVTTAKADQQKADQTAFAEQEKQPNRQLVGPDVLGSVTVSYPKTWSVYIGNNGDSNQYEAYLYPGAVPPLTSNTPYALRISVINQSYDQMVGQYQQNVKSGDIKSSPVTTEGEDGLRFDGKLSLTTNGSMVLFKLRDKTLKVYTEATTFQGDFDKTVLPSLKFNK